MNEVKERVLLDMKINKRCLNEDVPKVIKKLLSLWIEYDDELLNLIKRNESKGE